MTIYLHIRIVMSILMGLGLTTLLSGVAQIVEHPRRDKIYWVHLMWAGFVFLFLIHFWWFEYRLEKVSSWTFPLFLLVILYGVALFLLCSLLFPKDLSDYQGYEGYFYSRRVWIFGLLTSIYVIDVFDTMIKGGSYLQSLGVEYPVRAAVNIVCCAFAMETTNRKFHGVFAVLATAYQISFILRLFLTVE